MWFYTKALYIFNTKLYSAKSNWYRDGMDTVLQAVTYWMDTVLQAVTYWMETVLQAVTYWLDTVLQAVTYWMDTVLQAVTYWLDTVLQTVTYWLDTVLQAVTYWMDTVLQAVIYDLSLNPGNISLPARNWYEITHCSEIKFSLNYIECSFHSSNVTGWSVTAEDLVRSRINSCRIFGGQSGTGTFSSTHIFSLINYYSTYFQYLFIYYSKGWNLWALEVANPQANLLTPVPE